jgi:hypothetical protein
MTVNSPTNRVLSNGNGATTVWPFSFPVLSASDLVVIVTDPDGVSTVLLSTQYSTTGIGSPNGGTLTYPLSGSPLATGWSILIKRTVPLTQTTDIQNQGGFYPDIIERALDRIVFQVQQIAEVADRSLRFPDSESGLILPSLASRVGRFLGFDAGGAPVALSGTGADGALRADLASSLGGTLLVAWKAAGVGAVVRTLFAKIADLPLNPKDFGAVGDNVADDTLPIQFAFQVGGRVSFSKGTYKVSTVYCEGVAGLTVDARSATFTSEYGNLFIFDGCDDFTWQGGVFNAGTGKNPVYDIPATVGVIASNFTVYDANRIMLSEMKVVNSVTNAFPCITAWNVGQCQINNNQTYNGGDNSIWVFNGFHVTASDNVILNQERGRGICFQKVNQGAMTGNVCSGGKGDGFNVHGSANISIGVNSVYNMVVDPVILGLSSGVSIEWDENATPAQVAAAAADPQLYNGVFCRNITVSGNTIATVEFGVRVGNNIGITGNNYGNQGQVVIDGNSIFAAAVGISTGTSRQVRISSNQISTVNQGCIEINMGLDTGGYKAQDIYVADNRFTTFNTANGGYNAVQFNAGTPVASDRIVLTNNQWDNGQFSAGFTNITNAALSVMEGNNTNVNGVATSSTKSALMVQRQFSDQAGASTLTPFLIGKASHEFTQSGQVLDAFVTVLAIPANASIAAQIQIGTQDRVITFGTIYAHNGTTPALTFTGTGGTNVQLSGGNLQIRGSTAGGTLLYGGLYSIRYSLLNPS